MVTVRLTKSVGPNILTWGLGSIVARALESIRELIKMNSFITKIKEMVSNN
jgi:hypothetical protein